MKKILLLFLTLSSSIYSQNVTEKLNTKIPPPLSPQVIINVTKNTNKDILLGEFSMKQNGKAVVRITKKNDIYYKSEKNSKGTWTTPQPLKKLLTTEICTNFGFSNCDAIKEYAISKKYGGILYIDKDAPKKGEKFKSNFFILPWFDAYKVK